MQRALLLPLDPHGLSFLSHTYRTNYTPDRFADNRTEAAGAHGQGGTRTARLLPGRGAGRAPGGPSPAAETRPGGLLHNAMAGRPNKGAGRPQTPAL